MTIAGGMFGARRPQCVCVGGHELIRWESAAGTRLTPLARDVDVNSSDRLLAGIVFHMVSVVVVNAFTLLVPKDLLLQWLKMYAARL
jgi:hypothetical protein